MRVTTKKSVFGPLRILDKELKRLRMFPGKDEPHVEKTIQDLERFRRWRLRHLRESK